MAVTQYIGARYVPKFFDNPSGGSDWVSGVAYEPLTIVTYLSNSYTSKKPVPATVGDPSRNLDYWAPTGVYNAQVEEYRQLALSLESRVDDLETADDTIENSIDIIKSALRDRKFVLIGDSYGMRYDINWMNNFRTALGDNCLYASALSSHGFIAPNHQFLTILNNAINALTAAERETVTDVVVVGGWNDARAIKNGDSVANLQRAINTFCGRVSEAFPNAIVTLEYAGWQTGHGVQDNLTFGNLMSARNTYNGTYNKILRHGCSAFKVMLDCNNLDNSGFHPTEAAAAPLYYAILNDVMGSGYEYNASYNTRGGWTAGAYGGVLNTHQVSINGGVARTKIVITGITGASNNKVIGTFNALDAFPFPAWGNMSWNGFTTKNGSAIYCYFTGANGELKIFGDIPNEAFDLYMDFTFPLTI